MTFLPHRADGWLIHILAPLFRAADRWSRR